jgi:branched-chain amino acid transport system permease protein
MVMSLEMSMKFVLITILGGLGNLWGPLLGAMILIPLQEYTRAYLTVLGSGVDLIIFGLIIVLMMIKQPRGIMGIVTDFGARRRRAEARPDTGV